MKSQCEQKIVIIYMLVVTLSIASGQRCNGGVKCIGLYECKGLHTQLQRSNSPVITDLARSLHCGFQEDNIPKVCCPPEFLNQNEEVRTNRPTSPDLEAVTPLRIPPGLLPSDKVCGVQGTEKIVGGTVTDIDEHPWMALIRYDKPVGWGFYCGGVLISWRYVLTAAHCVKGSDLPSNWRVSQVRLGEWNTSSSLDCVSDDCTPPVQDIPVEQSVVHAQYDPADTNQHNDIALLRLSYNAQSNGFVRPICLPLSTKLQRATFEGADMEVAGWGKTETRSESDVKLKVSVPLVKNDECATVYTRVSRTIVNSQMCAGGISGRDSCRGDSGGPLMAQPPPATNWMVVGVVSYGPSPCGTPGWPGVYTRVGAYVNWIVSNMQL